MPHTQDEQPRSAFARGAESTVVELRGECPRQTVNVLDAVSMARNVPRTTVVNEILGEWAAKKLHESMLVNRVAIGNPTAPETSGAN